MTPDPAPPTAATQGDASAPVAPSAGPQRGRITIVRKENGETKSYFDGTSESDKPE